MESPMAKLTKAQFNKVSIPFKREGKWKDGEPNDALPTMPVSIPFKREGKWKERAARRRRFICEFQFPSNGKVNGKSVAERYIADTPEDVFQFPSNGKVNGKLEEAEANLDILLSFNSLQTGR